MFCKHLGTFKSKNQVTAELTTCLRQAGDIVSYHLEESGDTILFISYRRDLVFYQGDILARPKPFLIKPSTDQTCINTLKIKNYKGDINTLLQSIQKKLKIVCGFDFDLTLTVTHTYYKTDFSVSSKKDNQLYPQEAKMLLVEFASLPNCVAIIISNNYKAKINEYLKLWFDVIPFREVFGRDEFHNTNEGNKEACFYYFYRQIVNPYLVNDDNFLDLEKLETSEALDIVRGYMFDDEPMPSFATAGLNVIKVVPQTRSYLIELKYIFKLNAVKYDIHEVQADEDCVRIFKHIYHDGREPVVVVREAEKLAGTLYTALGSPLHLAVRAQLPWLVKLFLTQRADLRKLDAKKLTAAHYACLNSDITVLAMLLADRNYADLAQTLVKYAIQNNLSDVLAYILSFNRFNLDLYDENGLALIHHASVVGNPAMIKTLLKEGATKDLQTKDSNLRSPLHLCVSNYRRAAIIALLEAGANPFAADVDGMYPAQLALVLKKDKLPELFTATGTRINDRLRNGRTLLTNSIINYLKDRDLPMTLLQMTAIDPDLPDGLNERPVELATRGDFGPVIVALELRGVKGTPWQQPAIPVAVLLNK